VPVRHVDKSRDRRDRRRVGLVTIVAATASVDGRAPTGSPSLRVAVETAAALISLLAAQLALGRYARSTQQADLLLGAGLLVLALGTLGFSALPAVVGAEDDPVATWGALIARTAGVTLFALAAGARPRAIRHPARVGRLAAAGACAALVAILAALAIAGDALPSLARPDLAAAGAVWPPLDAGTLLQVATMLLFCAAAVGFTRRADRTGDAMARWLAIAATLGAFSRLNYLIHPSLGTSWFFAGDVLRFGFFVALLVAGIEELRRNQRELADAAVMDERQRIAREIHDGMAQDLAFIVQQGRHLQRRLEPARGLELIVMAAQRALDESREAVAALVRPPCQPLADALAQTAREAAEREGSTVDTDLVPDVAVPGATQEAMLRILREQ
jgi:signal transduction histidine kinase